jgi:hypothetical protein
VLILLQRTSSIIVQFHEKADKILAASYDSDVVADQFHNNKNLLINQSEKTCYSDNIPQERRPPVRSVGPPIAARRPPLLVYEYQNLPFLL